MTITPATLNEALTAYETAARGNRPDWAAFVADARQDPLAIAYEVQEHTSAHTGVHVFVTDDHFDTLYDAVTAWVIAPATARPTCEWADRIGFDEYQRCTTPATHSRWQDNGPDGDMENGPSRDYEPPSEMHLCIAHAAEHDNEVFEETHTRCPECAIEAGTPREAAFASYFGCSVVDTNPMREIVRSFSSGGADPTTLTKLSCGHTVGF